MRNYKETAITCYTDNKTKKWVTKEAEKLNISVSCYLSNLLIAEKKTTTLGYTRNANNPGK